MTKTLEKSHSFDFESNGGFKFGHFVAFMLNFPCEVPNKCICIIRLQINPLHFTVVPLLVSLPFLEWGMGVWNNVHV